MKFRKLNELDKRWESFADSYLVCDDGHIYSIKSNGKVVRLKSGYYRNKKYPYQQVRGCFGTDKQHTVKVHQAVAKAFVPNPHGFSDIDHINNDKTDNRVENLSWISHRENLRKKAKDKTRLLGMGAMLLLYTAFMMAVFTSPLWARI